MLAPLLCIIFLVNHITGSHALNDTLNTATSPTDDTRVLQDVVIGDMHVLLNSSLGIDNSTLITLTTPRKKLLIKENSTLTLSLNRTATEELVFNCTPSSTSLLDIHTTGDLVVIKSGTKSSTVNITAGRKGGTFFIATHLVRPNASSNISIHDLDMSVVHSKTLETVIDVLGWLCFATWSISFYPQVYKNWVRKNVVGLSFDFLGYNMLGWVCYSSFNFALLWIQPVREEYYQAYPHGVINVQLSDFCFSFHALILTGVTIVQCLFYERGGQKPSTLCLLILAGFVCGMVLMLIVAMSSCVTWFQYVSIFSYVKLAVTLFKYSPQVYVNFKKKSTEAVSIYQFLLDLTGGAISLFQMGLIAYNYDDWRTFLGDFTKFGLAALSILYDVIFIFQHYCLYREPAYQHLGEDREEGEESSKRLLGGESE